MDRVRNKVAIVTGGASGLGKSSAILLAREGAKIEMYTHGRKETSSIFSNSIAESVTNHSKQPVMTIHL